MKDVALYGPTGHLIQTTGTPSQVDRALRSLRRESRALFAASETTRHNANWNAQVIDINYALNSELSTMRKRSRWLAFNDANGAAFCSNLVNYCVGVGFDLSMAVANRVQVGDSYRLIEREAFNEYVEDRYALWCEDALVDGSESSPVHDHELQELAFRNWAIDGEVFAHAVIDRSRGGDVPLVWELVDPEQLDTTRIDAPNGNPVVMGVELDKRSWRPVAYWVFKYDRERPMYQTRYTSVRIPASEMVHLFTRLVPRQVRGVPFFHAVMNRFYQLAEYDNAQLIRNKIAALFSVFVVGGSGGSGFLTDDGAGQTIDGETQFPVDANGNVVGNLQAGIIGALPQGYDLKTVSPTSPDATYSAFLDAQRQAISAGAGPGMSVTGMTRDTSKTTFAGGRQAENMDIQGYRPLMAKFCSRFQAPRFRKWLDLAVLTGDVIAPTYDVDPKFWQRHTWKPGGWSRGINPLQEVNAARESMREGITTLDDECSFLGRDWRMQLQKSSKITRARMQEFSAIKAEAERLGVSPAELAMLMGNASGTVSAIANEPAAAELAAQGAP